MSDTPTAADLEAYARLLAQQQGLDPDFVAGIGKQESGFNPAAMGPPTKSGQRAIGPMQLMPDTADSLGVDPSDPYDNVKGGVTYLAQLSKQFNGDPSLTAAAYNAGPGAVHKAGGVPNFPETQKYVANVTTANVDPSTIDWGTAPASSADAIPDASQIDWGAPATPDVPTKAATADANLPQTLEVAGLNTHIPLPTSIAAGLVGAGKATARIGQGIQQGYNWLTGGNNPQNLSDLVTNSSPGARLAAQVKADNAAYAPLADAHPLATGIGESLPAMAIPLGGAGGAVSALARSAAANALPGLLSYGDATDRLKSGGVGAAGGAIGSAAGGLLGRLISPFRAADPAAQAEINALADQYGVHLTPAQSTGSSALKSLQSTLATFPGSSSVMAAAKQDAAGSFNRAVLNTMGEGGLLGDDGAVKFGTSQKIADNFGPKYDAAVQGVNIDPATLLDGMSGVEGQYGKVMSPDNKPVVGAYIDSILNNGNPIPGDQYQMWRSRLGTRAAGSSDTDFSSALKGLQGTLDQGFDTAAGPAQAAAMQATRGQYRNYKTLQPLIEKAALTTDNISPVAVAHRVQMSGNPQLADLAKLGSGMGDYPNSGTAPRLLWQEWLKHPIIGTPTLVPAAAGANLLAKMMTSSPGEKYLANNLLSQGGAQALMKYAGLLGLAGTNVATRP